MADWHFDAQVFGMSMMTISPGINGIGSRDKKAPPHELMKAALETVFIGIGGMLVTKSYWPLLMPFAYLTVSSAWDQSRFAASIDATAPDELEGVNDYGTFLEG